MWANQNWSCTNGNAGGAKIPNGIATELIQCVLLKFSSMKLFAGQLNSHLAPSVLHEESLKV